MYIQLFIIMKLDNIEHATILQSLQAIKNIDIQRGLMLDGLNALWNSIRVKYSIEGEFSYNTVTGEIDKIPSENK